MEGAKCSRLLRLYSSQSLCLLLSFVLRSGTVGHVHVHANELVFASNQPCRSTGDVEFSVQSPIDKGRVFASLLDGVGIGEGLGSPPSKQNDMVTCFVGDSITDLIPLLIADFGIVAGDSASLKDALRSFGVRALPLTCASLGRVSRSHEASRLPCAKGDARSRLGASKGVLYTAESWLEIKAFLFGHQDLLEPQ